jgi:hypothetical protein
MWFCGLIDWHLHKGISGLQKELGGFLKVAYSRLVYIGDEI